MHFHDKTDNPFPQGTFRQKKHIRHKQHRECPLGVVQTIVIFKGLFGRICHLNPFVVRSCCNRSVQQRKRRMESYLVEIKFCTFTELLHSADTLRAKGKARQRTLWNLLRCLRTRNGPANHDTTSLSTAWCHYNVSRVIFYFKFLLSCTFSFIQKTPAISPCFILTMNIQS